MQLKPVVTRVGHTWHRNDCGEFRRAAAADERNKSVDPSQMIKETSHVIGDRHVGGALDDGRKRPIEVKQQSGLIGGGAGMRQEIVPRGGRRFHERRR